MSKNENLTMLDKKGLCKVLKNTYPRGYEYVPEGGTVTINGRSWAVQCATEDLPVEAAVMVVENVGYMPTEALLVQKGLPNQVLMKEAVRIRMDFFAAGGGELLGMKKIPVIFHGRWQLYQEETGEIFGFDMNLLEIIDWKAAEPTAYMGISGGMGLWTDGESTLYVAPGRFCEKDAEKLRFLASLDWENQMKDGEDVANMSLFDEDDVPAMEGE